MRHTSLHKVGLKSTVADFEVGDNDTMKSL